jgi:hypothetical protein
MTPKQAFELISRFAEQYKGTLQEHQALQAALKILNPEKTEPKQ